MALAFITHPKKVVHREHSKLRRRLRVLMNKPIFYRLSLSRGVELPKLFDWLQLKNGEVVLDVACGSGWMSHMIAKKGCLVSGIEISEHDIEHAIGTGRPGKIQPKFIVGNAEFLPYRAWTFDKVVCGCALEHFQYDGKALGEMCRVLKKGGCLVLTVDSLSYPKMKNERIERHKQVALVVNLYTRDELTRKLEEAGFEVERSEYYLNSFLSAFFFDCGVKLLWDWRFLAMSLIARPLCSLTDRIWGSEMWGMGLIAKGRKL